MKPYLGFVAFAIVIFGFATPAFAATCAPEELVHITIVNVTPGLARASFAAQPKNLYRIGSDKLRVEEAIDSANGIHGVVVVAESNIWMANPYDNTGKHVSDPGPTFLARAPVFGKDVSAKLLDLEFGCEAAFIDANAPKPVRSEQIGNVTFEVYRFDDGPDAIEILERSGTSVPAFARYYHQGNLVSALRYDLYLTGLANDSALFVPPPNVRYTEANQR
ncbi:MAG: hypothetical protein WCB99_12045 [Candidatus Cybelea sp.]